MEGREGKGELPRLVEGELCSDEGRPASGNGRSSSWMCSSEAGLEEDFDSGDSINHTARHGTICFRAFII